MITILMAAYNGEKYIGEQIDSILNQTVSDWELVIQDDCSKDNTPCIAKKYAEYNPDKIRFIQRDSPSGSAKANFFSMLQYADSEYCMTCDDDDIWLPEKIQITIDKMKELEMGLGTDKPILVHTDLKVVGRDLSVISDSMFHRQSLDSNRDQFNNILVQNIVTGCTMMVNHALLDMVNEVPQQAIMHDWWFALIASAFGRIGFVSAPTILYRQHGGNEVGAKNAKSLSYNLERLKNAKHSQAVLQNTYLQAQEFINYYKQQLEDSKLKPATAYAGLFAHSKMRRLQILSQYHLWKNGFIRKCGQIFYI